MTIGAMMTQTNRSIKESSLDKKKGEEGNYRKTKALRITKMFFFPRYIRLLYITFPMPLFSNIKCFPHTCTKYNMCQYTTQKKV